MLSSAPEVAERADSSTPLAAVGMTAIGYSPPSAGRMTEVRCRALDHSIKLPLEIKLQGKLHRARVSRLQYLAERCVAEISIRIHKLGFVEQIKDVCSELEVLSL